MCFNAGRTYLSVEGSMVYARNSLIASIEKAVSVTGLRVDFLKGELTSQLHGQ